LIVVGYGPVQITPLLSENTPGVISGGISRIELDGPIEISHCSVQITLLFLG
jgi:hypothetical protein